MSVWARVQSLPGVGEIYGPHFPLEVRHFFASWLESQQWHSVNEENEELAPAAQDMVDSLLRLMRSKIEELQSGADDTFLLRLRLEEILQDFEKRYAKEPLAFVGVVKGCLQREREILEHGMAASTAHIVPTVVGGVDEKTLGELVSLQKQVESADVQLKALQQQQEFFVIQYQELCKAQSGLSNVKPDALMSADAKKRVEGLKSRRQQLERVLSEEGTKILRKRKILATFYQDCLKSASHVQSVFVVEKLDKWKSAQCLGMTSEEEQVRQLDCLQPECERLVEILWMLQTQLRQLNVLQEQLFLKPEEPGDNTLSLSQHVMSQCIMHLRHLLQQSFVIEKQPPQVLKTQTKFVATARLLIGGKLNVHMSPPEVRATIISQPQARTLQGWSNDILNNVPQAHHMLETLSNVTGTLMNDRKSFEYAKENMTLKAAFKSLSLKKIKRRDTKADEVVTEEKFAMLLYCTLTLGDMQFCVHTQSNPSVVIVHGNQFANAVATILWDNFFGERNREAFVVPDAVPWSMAAVALSNHFLVINKVPLKESHLDVLKKKIIGSNPDGPLTWTAFNRDTLPLRSFTFWEWFYGIEEVVRKHIHGPWVDNLVVGFISKKDAEHALMQHADGTFLLRFSDSEIGGVSVSWVADDGAGTKHVWHLQPWFAKDLMIRSLADRLGDLSQLRLLYPSRVKDEAFRKYYTPSAAYNFGSSDYVRTSIAATILMDNGGVKDEEGSSSSGAADAGNSDIYIKPERHEWMGDEMEDSNFMSSVLGGDRMNANSPDSGDEA